MFMVLPRQVFCHFLLDVLGLCVPYCSGTQGQVLNYGKAACLSQSSSSEEILYDSCRRIGLLMGSFKIVWAVQNRRGSRGNAS
jgi:hypothetical protein